MFTTLLPFLTFLAIGATILLLGQLLIGHGRTRGVSDLDDRMPRLVFGPLTEALAGLFPLSARRSSTIQQELKRAGYYRPQARKQFMAIRNALIVGWVILTAVTVVAAFDPHHDRTGPIIVAGAVVVALLYAMPRLLLQSLANRRLRNIQTGLPDALDMITMCLTGGLPLPQAPQ